MLCGRACSTEVINEDDVIISDAVCAVKESDGNAKISTMECELFRGVRRHGCHARDKPDIFTIN